MSKREPRKRSEDLPAKDLESIKRGLEDVKAGRLKRVEL